MKQKIQKKFDEKLKERFLIYTNFLTMITTSLFDCCKKVFIFMSIWMIRKSSMKYHYLKKKIFTILLQISTGTDSAHAKGICKDFEIKNLGEYHDLYVQSDTLLLADVFENFINICLKIYDLDPAKFQD